MWVYRSITDPINLFDFTVRRHRDGPELFLEGFSGSLMADCYSGYEAVRTRSDGRIIRAACAAGYRAADLFTLVSSALDCDLDVFIYVKDVLDKLLAGCSDYHSLRPDVWRESHPEAVRMYRQDERRHRAEAKSIKRAKRRLGRK